MPHIEALLGASPLHLLLLVLAGLVAGFVNMAAGGGSLLTLPALMLLGLPADVANGTNRVGIFVQALTGLRGFAKEGALEKHRLFAVLVPTVLGAAAGSALAAFGVPREALRPVLIATMITMALAMTFRPALLDPTEGEALEVKGSPKAVAGLLLAGFYGGFVQAGVGFVLLSVLCGVLRLDLAKANALKLAAVLAFGTVALGIFIAAGQVAWGMALVLAASSMIGARLGVRFATRFSKKAVRRLVLAMVFAACGALFLKG